MFLGQSRYDPNTFGWAGHREDGGHFSVQGEIVRYFSGTVFFQVMILETI